MLTWLTLVIKIATLSVGQNVDLNMILSTHLSLDISNTYLTNYILRKHTYAFLNKSVSLFSSYKKCAFSTSITLLMRLTAVC